MTSLVDCLESHAAAHPDRRLSSFLNVDGSERRSYTYGSFAEHTRRLAGHLAGHVGLKHGDRALLAYPPGSTSSWLCSRARTWASFPCPCRLPRP